MKKINDELIIQKLKGGLSNDDCYKIDEFFAELEKRIDLPIVSRNVLLEHFYYAFEYYLDNDYKVDEIVKLINPVNLKYFYKFHKRQYLTLDNAAIVYPLGMRYGKMPLFRLSATLKQDVIPSLLQLAVDFTIKRFPSFSAVIKTGFFWHYLETTNHINIIEQESDIPCKPISVILRSYKSIRVLYYKKRISVEFFHAITDGAGGMVFLKTLLREYLRLLGKNIPCSDGILDCNDEVDPLELVNEFNNAQANNDMSTFLDKPSLQLEGKYSKTYISKIIHYELDSKKVLDLAHKYEGSVTAYILAILFMASKKSISAKSGLFNIQVPVNMRKFNNSKTLRNYSMYFSVSKKIEDITDQKNLVLDMNEQIKTKGDVGIMSQMMATTRKIIQMVYYVPVFLKKPIVSIAYGYLGNQIIAFSLSNLGVIKIPNKMNKLIDCFDFVFVPTKPNKVTCSLVSYNNKMRLTIIRSCNDDRFENEVLKLLKKDGLDVIVEGSEDYEF